MNSIMSLGRRRKETIPTRQRLFIGWAAAPLSLLCFVLFARTFRYRHTHTRSEKGKANGKSDSQT